MMELMKLEMNVLIIISLHFHTIIIRKIRIEMLFFRCDIQ